MDAVAVSISCGFKLGVVKIHQALKIAFFFGFFQAGMPVIGWYAGVNIIRYIALFDHWVAFGLLLFVGVKMIYESFRKEEPGNGTNPLDLKVLLLLSIATSIDALAVGLSLAIINVSIITAISIIGFITFFLSFTSVYIGKKCGCFFGKRVELIGGFILIGIGLKILIQHLIQQAQDMNF
ncbi:manganese efflux pump [candidate division KSB1 bacterium]|nr:manganese efflux pump [candidate division KSB1 bacterium]